MSVEEERVGSGHHGQDVRRRFIEAEIGAPTVFGGQVSVDPVVHVTAQCGARREVRDARRGGDLVLDVAVDARRVVDPDRELGGEIYESRRRRGELESRDMTVTLRNGVAWIHLTRPPRRGPWRARV